MKVNDSFQNLKFSKNNLFFRDGRQALATGNAQKQPDKKTAGTAGGQDFKYSRGPRILKQPEAKNTKNCRGARGQKVIKQRELKNQFFLKINEGQFCPRCPAGGPALEK